MTVRFYIDEETSPQLAILARASGLDAVSAHERGARGLSDEEQLTLATAEGRAIVSSNTRDFRRIARDWAKNDREHSGIVLSYKQITPSRLEGAALCLRRIGSLHDDLLNTTIALDSFIERV